MLYERATVSALDSNKESERDKAVIYFLILVGRNVGRKYLASFVDKNSCAKQHQQDRHQSVPALYQT